MFWNQVVETLPKADMAVWQNHKLIKLVERVYEKSEFYHKRMEEHDVKPEGIKSVDDLVKLPLTNRSDVADNYPYGLLTLPISSVSYIHKSQDADKMPTAVGYTGNDMVMWTELMSRMLVAGGVNVTSVFQMALSGEQYPSRLGVCDGARQIGAAFVAAASDTISQQVLLIQDFGVNGVFSTAEYMLALAQEARNIGIDPKELPLHTIFCSIQSLEKNGFTEIEKEYGVQVLGIYGLDDVFGMGIGGECHCRDGIHIQEDCFYPEVVDPANGQVLPAGQRGELVLTSLIMEAMPLIRYRTGIQGYLDGDQCACGRTLVRLKK
ncbi:MAG: phenylacetate--CoA ligase family protein [Sporomusaceae bacterium]|nr:phenylacetate--CoA ligase family protein [Sporomusaceae bacterium]